MKKILIHLLLLASSGHAAPCANFSRYTWTLDLNSRAVKRVAKSEKDTSLCELPRSGQENTSLEIKDGESVVFQRDIYVHLERFYDVIGSRDPAQIESGGHVPDPQPVVIAYLPADLSNRVKIIFRGLNTRAVLAEGKP